MVQLKVRRENKVTKTVWKKGEENRVVRENLIKITLLKGNGKKHTLRRRYSNYEKTLSIVRKIMRELLSV